MAPNGPQKKFKHAPVFGISGNFNAANGRAFADALRSHVQSRGTTAIQGAYRNAKNLVTYHLDKATGKVVLTDRKGNFISAYKANEQQVRAIIEKGWGF